jgi:hypothetical protein
MRLFERFSTNSLEACFRRELWPDLKFFALVLPDHDIFPIRAAYNDKEPDKLNIGDNYLTSAQPLWYAGPDIIRSILRTGRVPTILKAVRLVPHGKQKGMQSVKLMGEIPFDPYRNGDDFFKLVIEAKERAGRDAEIARRMGDKAAETKSKALKHTLKTTASSTSYGCFVQLDENKQSTPVKLGVFSGEHFHFESGVTEIEVPGPYYFAPLGALITAGGRLLLGMAEACVTEAGGTWMAADTDSIMVVANKNGSEVVGARKRVEDDVAIREGSIKREGVRPSSRALS